MSDIDRTLAEEPVLATIGIAAFNAERTIERALVSALAQSWRSIEIVVVDDCSTDATPEILENLAEAHAEIRFVREEINGGVARARNRIIDLAKGDFIAFFDDDDESAPDRVARQIERIGHYEQSFAAGAPVICHTARTQCYPDGTVAHMPTMGEGDGRPAPSGLSAAERILVGVPLKDGFGACATCSQMARTSVYRNLSGFDPEFRRSEDTELIVRHAKRGGHIVGVADELVTQYVMQRDGKSLGEDLAYMVRLLEKHRDVADGRGLYRFSRNWLDLKQAWYEGRRGAFVRLLTVSALRDPWMTARRFLFALPHAGLNAAFARFHVQR